MSKMRYFDSDFWTDNWVVDVLNPHDRYLFIYLFTNSHCNLAGVYEISLRVMAFESGIESEELARMLKKMEPKVYYLNGWVVLANAVRNQNYKNQYIKAGIQAVLREVPPELVDRINWPTDFGEPKPAGSNQTRLLDGSEDPNGVVNSVITTRPRTDEVITTPTGVSEDSYRTPGELNIIKSNITKHNDLPNGKSAEAAAGKIMRSAAIDEMFEYWDQAIGYKLESNVKWNRRACSNLLKKHGKLKLQRIIAGVATAKKDRYAPRIADFAELQKRFNELMSWGHQRNSKKSKVRDIK